MCVNKFPSKKKQLRGREREGAGEGEGIKEERAHQSVIKTKIQIAIESNSEIYI